MLYKILILLFISTITFGQFTSEHTGDHIDSVITGVEDLINPTQSPSFPIGQGADSTWGVVNLFDFKDTLGINSITPEQYGAVGDGVTNDRDAFLAALDSGLPVRGKSGATYKIGSSIEIIDKNIDLSSTDKEPFYLLTESEVPVFTFTGSELRTTTLKSAIYPGQNKLVLDSLASEMTVNNVLTISTPELSEYYSVFEKGETHKILKISGDSVWTESFFMTDYGDSTVTLTEYTAIKVNISNVSASVEDTSVYDNESAFRIDRAIDSKFENIHLTGYQFQGLFLNQTYNTKVDKVNIRMSNKLALGYGLMAYSSNITLISNSYFSENRHAIDLSGNYASANVIVSGCFFNGTGFVNTGDDAMTHPSHLPIGVASHIVNGLLVENNTFINLARGVQVRGGNADVIGNRFWGNISIGVAINGTNTNIIGNTTSDNLDNKDTIGVSTNKMNNFVSITNRDSPGYLNVSNNFIKGIQTTFILNNDHDTLYANVSNNDVVFSNTIPADEFKFVSGGNAFFGYLVNNYVRNLTGNTYTYLHAAHLATSVTFDYSEADEEWNINKPFSGMDVSDTLKADALIMDGLLEGDLKITFGASQDATIDLIADRSDDNGDAWRLVGRNANSEGTSLLQFQNDFGGSLANKMVIGGGGDVTAIRDLISSRNVLAGDDDSEGVIQESPDGRKWMLKIADDGTVSADSTGLN